MNPEVLITVGITGAVGALTAIVSFVVGHSNGRATRKAALEQARATIVAAALEHGVEDLAVLNKVASLATDQPSLTGAVVSNPHRVSSLHGQVSRSPE